MTSIIMLFCFPVQNFTEIEQSAAELSPQNDFKMTAIRHLDFFIIFIFRHFVTGLQICICVPNSIKIG